MAETITRSMIRLKIRQPHRSISHLPDTELPDFAVITGINGSGKTHLLEAIEQGAVQVEGIGHGHNAIRRYDWMSLVPEFDNTANPLQHRQALEQATKHARESLVRHRTGIADWFPHHNIQGNEVLIDLRWLLATNAEELSKELSSATRNGRPLNEQAVQSVSNSFLQHRKSQTQGFLNELGNYGCLSDALIKRAHSLKQSPLGLDEALVEEEMPLFLNPAQSLQFRLAEWFATYHHAWEFNAYHRYRATVKEEKGLYWLSDDHFIARYGPKPWEIVNSIFGKARLPYIVNYPTGSAESEFVLRLFDPSKNGLTLRIDELSSGEKIILSVALLLYQTTSGTRLAALPKLLLLDEVDAPLHPSFTRVLLDTLKHTLVDSHGLKIIMATHSPSTVALAPMGSVFELRREPRQLTLTTPSQATQILSAGFVSITPNDVIVIAEAGTDRDYYQAIHDALVRSGYLKSNPALKFIAASAEGNDGQGGGCAQVQQWAPKLADLGLIRFRGLIDRDSGTPPSDVIKILNRYSVENYILDPLTLVALLIRAGIHEPFSEVPIENRRIHDLPKLPAEELERLANELCAFLGKSAPEFKERGSGMFEARFVGVNTIKLPTWVRDARGHRSDADAFGLCHEIMRIMNDMAKSVGKGTLFVGKFQSTIDLQAEILPEFIPAELRDTFEELKH